MPTYRYRCTKRQTGPHGDKPRKNLDICGKRHILTQAQHDRAQAGEEFKCSCGYKITFTKADYASQRRQRCTCPGRPLAHRRGQKGCTHDNRGFANEDEYRDFVNGMQAAFS